MDRPKQVTAAAFGLFFTGLLLLAFLTIRLLMRPNARGFFDDGPRTAC